MPRVARFRIAAIGELFRQLQFVPRATLLRQMDAAEALVSDLDAALNYPEDFVVYRITGYRPDGAGASSTLVGEALVSDLVTFVQCLSDRVDVPSEHDGRQALPLDDVAERLSISTKTVQRYRRQGLVCHYAVFPDGVKRLACFDDALDRFVAGHAARVDRARRFSRLDREAERRIVEAAAAMRRDEGLSLNEAALRISTDHGRAHETIRGLLRRHDRRSGDPIFAEHGPLAERDVRLIERASAWGVSTQRLGRRFGKTPVTIRRALHRRRGDRLLALPLGFVTLPTFKLEDAETVILSAPPVTGGLDLVLPNDDAEALLGAAREAVPIPEDFEHALIAGFNMLKARALDRRSDLPAWPGATALDAIETDLRWAGRVKRRLVSLGLPAAVRTIELNLHRGLLTQPAERVEELLRLAVDRVAALVEAIDPGRGQHLEPLVAQSVDRALAGMDVEALAARASARHGPGDLALVGLLDRLTPWDDLLGLAAAEVARLDALEAPRRALVVAHYGLGSEPPATLEQLTAQFDLSRSAVQRRLRAARLELRAVGR